jgi:hypothetical protein
MTCQRTCRWSWSKATPVSTWPPLRSTRRRAPGPPPPFLLSCGHQTVFHVAGPPEWQESQGRASGWLSALDEAGAEVTSALPGDWTARSGYRAGRVLARVPEATAIFVANDQMALGVLLALHERNRRVPEEVSVIGFDDIPESAYFTPPLTTVRQDFDQVGRASLRLLLDQIESGARSAGPGGGPVPTGGPSQYARGLWTSSGGPRRVIARYGAPDGLCSHRQVDGGADESASLGRMDGPCVRNRPRLRDGFGTHTVIRPVDGRGTGRLRTGLCRRRDRRPHCRVPSERLPAGLGPAKSRRLHSRAGRGDLGRLAEGPRERPGASSGSASTSRPAPCSRSRRQGVPPSAVCRPGATVRTRGRSCGSTTRPSMSPTGSTRWRPSGKKPFSGPLRGPHLLRVVLP